MTCVCVLRVARPRVAWQVPPPVPAGSCRSPVDLRPSAADGWHVGSRSAGWAALALAAAKTRRLLFVAQRLVWSQVRCWCWCRAARQPRMTPTPFLFGSGARLCIVFREIVFIPFSVEQADGCWWSYVGNMMRMHVSVKQISYKNERKHLGSNFQL